MIIPFRGPNFTMQVPSEWLITATPQVQTLFLSPESDLPVQANLSVTIRGAQDDVTADAVADSVIETQRQSFADFNLHERSSADVGGVEGETFVCRWLNADVNTHITQAHRIALKDNRLYSLTATYPDGVSDEVVSTLAGMLDSFRFT